MQLQYSSQSNPLREQFENDSARVVQVTGSRAQSEPPPPKLVLTIPMAQDSKQRRPLDAYNNVPRLSTYFTLFPIPGCYRFSATRPAKPIRRGYGRYEAMLEIATRATDPLLTSLKTRSGAAFQDKVFYFGIPST